MVNISIRKLDDYVYKLFQLNASNHGVSIEEEVRSILTNAVSPAVSITTIFAKHFSSGIGDNLELPKREPHNPIELGDDHP